ncbi:hypothetical protein GSI_04381 [Ganoderma sinense ZZ0214-1]|uniref:SGNH hydrolase-type esterase domain-containing protein n=1 Tax=Ganoderma sinense ZZ0214-1 TaxID=1077348 RepID=A0A2G8SJ05_9APHY|nr:hypothetical protein GSI_04381 [Ganoderma sinense ZZ0214-1]
MFSKLSGLVALACAAFTTSAPTKRVADSLGWAKYWFAFGDSYTSRGFNVSGTLPAPGNPFGNPAYPGATGVGANWLDFDTTVYNRTLILTYDYAAAGATINTTLVAPTLATRDFIQQVDEFEAGAAQRPTSAPWTSFGALFSVWFGINDINNSYEEGGDRETFSDVLLDEYFAQVERLQRAQAFASSHWGVRQFVWDSNSAFNVVLDNPTKYGFVDATSYGQTGDFWANDFHPSSNAHNIWAQDVAALLNNTIWF